MSRFAEAPGGAGLDERLLALRLDPEDVYVAVQDYLDEDLSHSRRDVTSESIFGPAHTSTVAVTARADGLLAGLPVAHAVFHAMPGDVESLTSQRKARASAPVRSSPGSRVRPGRCSPPSAPR